VGREDSISVATEENKAFSQGCCYVRLLNLELYKRMMLSKECAYSKKVGSLLFDFVLLLGQVQRTQSIDWNVGQYLLAQFNTNINSSPRTSFTNAKVRISNRVWYSQQS
jgi:hypothetical protein